MEESKLLEALALVGLYPGDKFRVIGEDTAYYIDKNFGIFKDGDDIIYNEKLGGILSNPNLVIKLPIISKKRKRNVKSIIHAGV